MPKADPNITERNTRALTVPCPYCGAGIGMECWTLRSAGSRAYNATAQPHKRRIKDSWKGSLLKAIQRRTKGK